MKTMFPRARRYRNPQQHVDNQSVMEQTTAAPFFANGHVQPKREGAFFQPKLTIGKADDQYEKEADAVADKVVSGQAAGNMQNDTPSVQRLATPDEDKMPSTNDGRMAEDKQIQEKPEIQRVEKPEEEPAVQAKSEEEEPIQAKEEEEPIQAKANNATGGTASKTLTNQINSTKGRGNPLPTATKARMESAFGRDFSGVNVHTDSQSVGMNQEIHAQAFTHGKDIYFNAGKFQPQNTEGSRLLAHELTHVVQQKGDTIQKGGEKDDDEAKAVAAAKAKLIGTFKLISVDDGDEKWTSAHLALVEKALASLPAADKIAVQGLKLIRTKNLGGQDSRTQGQFSPNNTLAEIPTITLTDKAFNEVEAQESIKTLIHEVGHAVAALKSRPAHASLGSSIDDYNIKRKISNAAGELLGSDKPAFKPYKDKFAEFETKNNERNQKIDEQTPLIEKLKKPKPQKEHDTLMLEWNTLEAEIDRLGAEANALKAEADILYAEYQKLEKDYETKKAATDTANKETETRDKALKATMIAPADLAQISTTADAGKKVVETNTKKPLPGTEKDKTEASAYSQAVNQAATAILKFHDDTKAQTSNEKEIDALIKIVDNDIKTRNTEKENLTKLNAKNPILGSLAATEKAQDDYYKAAKAYSLAHDRKAIIQAFVKFVEANNISPNLTKYAADSWPHKPEEFYAEAYSFFVADNAALEKHSPKLNAWFKANSYRP